MSQDEHSANASPWHQGEKLIQERLGVATRMEDVGRRVIRDYMPDQHRTFYQQLPFMLLGSVDAEGNAWASIIEGKPGFVQSPDPRHLSFQARLQASDPAASNLMRGRPIGLLGIELHTRRRNRMNGRIHQDDAHGFSVEVEHSFGNCPQYIQIRDVTWENQEPTSVSTVEHMSHLDAEAQAFIRAADTCFLASYVDRDGNIDKRSVDISHRGGKTGFVDVDGDNLTIPDFPGNFFFNTLGNLMTNPRAGLLFIDFENGDLLQINAKAEIVFDGPEVVAFQGAERLLRLHVYKIIRRRKALAFRARFREFSPNSSMMGSWEQARARKAADELRSTFRPHRVTRIEKESSGVVSYYLDPQDGAGIPSFQPGQHAPIRVKPDGSQTLLRTYSFSSAPSDTFLRISVKREGVVSKYLHERMQVGSILEMRGPQGEFIVDTAVKRPVVLLAAGIGMTPLLSMLRHLVYEGERKRGMRRTYLVVGARNIAERAFDAEIRELTARAGAALSVVRVLSQPEETARKGVDYDVAGHIDVDLLKTILPFDDYDFYVCGPGAFTQSMYDGLRDLRIADDRIFAEQFGPSTLRRRLDAGTISPYADQKPAATVPVNVQLARTGKVARFLPGAGTLLDFAEQNGATPEFSCRGGSCGTCKTRVIQGHVHYAKPPALKLRPDEALICCAVPAATEDDATPLILDL